MDYQFEELCLGEGDGAIYLQRCVIKTKEKTPVVIFSHGFNGSHADKEREAKYLAERGFASVRFDFRGGSTYTQSALKMQEMTLLTELSDLERVLEFTRSREEYDGGAVYLFGESQGGFVSSLAAEKHAGQLKGMFLLYPALCIQDDWVKAFPFICEIPDVVEVMGCPLGRNYFLCARGLNALQSLIDSRVKTTIFHGTEDKLVDIAYSRKAANETFCKLYEFEGEGHGFSPKGQDLVIGRTCNRLLSENSDYIKRIQS